jgi:hypothetical protein
VQVHAEHVDLQDRALQGQCAEQVQEPLPEPGEHGDLQDRGLIELEKTLE